MEGNLMDRSCCMRDEGEVPDETGVGWGNGLVQTCREIVRLTMVTSVM